MKETYPQTQRDWDMRFVKPRRFVPVVSKFIFLVAVFAVIAQGVRWFYDRCSGPTMVVEYPREIDLGTRMIGDVVECPFSILNVSSRQITVDQFSTSCSCAGVEHKADGRPERVESITIPPHRQHEFSVRIGIGTRVGTQQFVTVYFRISDPRQDRGAIRIIIPKIGGGFYTEPAVVLLGSHRPGVSVRQIVEVYDNGINDTNIEYVLSSQPDRFQVRRLPLTADDRKKAHEIAGHLVEKIEVIARTDKESLLDGEILFKASGQLKRPNSIPVCGQIVDRIRVSPSFVLLPQRGIGNGSRSVTLFLEDRDNGPIAAKVMQAPEHLRVEVRPAATDQPDQIQLSVTLNADATLPELIRRLNSIEVATQTTDGQRMIEIPVFIQAAEHNP